MMTYANPITPSNLFDTPENVDVFAEWLDGFNGNEKTVALTAASKAWNLASKLVDECNKPQVLRNGATVLQRRETDDANIDVLLCSKPTDNGVEYVTWIQNKDDVSRGYDGTYHGHYFNGHYDGDSAWRKANADFWNRS